MVEDIEPGNGHNPEADDLIAEEISERGKNFTGGSGTLDPQRKFITMENKEYKSVLQQVLNSIKSDDDFRQALATARWRSDEDWEEWTNAYAECVRYGAPTDWLINRLIAQSAGVEGGKLRLILDTISHTTYNINSNNPMNQKRGFLSMFRGRSENNSDKRSPLS